MNKSLLLFFILVIAFVSCSTPKEQPPVPAEKMQSVLLDIQLAEAYSAGLNKDTLPAHRYDKNFDSLSVFYSEILSHHDLSFNGFNKAMDWYKMHPAAMDTLVSGVIEDLNKEKAKNGVQEEQTKNEDSAQLAKHQDSSLIDKGLLKRDSHNQATLSVKDSSQKAGSIKPKSLTN